jgi:autotransporter-associated beta strand protein
MSNGVTAGGGGRDFSLDGPAGGEIDGSITQNSGDSLNVYAVGTGLWYLNGQSSYTGTTIVSNGTLVVNGFIASSPVTADGGTLGGIGTLTGPVVVAAGATLAPTLATGPSTPIGTLTINNTLTLQPGSVTAVQISHAAVASDQIAGLTSVTYGGTLSVTNQGGTMAAGDSFQLFNAASYTGAFSSITPAAPGPGLVWNLAGLTVNGLLTVSNAAPPTFTSPTLSGGKLILSGTGGSPGAPYLLLSSTNLATPLANWTQVTNGFFSGLGNFAITNTLATNVPQMFFILEAP